MSAAKKMETLAAKVGTIDGEDAANALYSARWQLLAVVEAAERREDFAAPSVARLVADLDEALTVGGKTKDKQ